MNEKLLQFIWQFQYFNTADLQTSQGEPLSILQKGNFNTNQGPDFKDARIKVSETLLAGHIELHVKASDWILHRHSNDVNYNNVILHVVWENNQQLPMAFPVLELKDRVSKLLLKKFDELMGLTIFIPCEKAVKQVPQITWTTWKQRIVVERLQQKATVIAGYLSSNNNHWEEGFWWLLAKNFGIKVNSEAFEKIAQSLPLTVLSKHKNQLHQTEALLFGQAGLLNGQFKDAYMIMLQKEYQFLRQKYKLNPVHISLQFLRMRPSNFPTVRLAQLAMLIHNSIHLFSIVREAPDVVTVKKLLDVTANDYWHYHYIPDEESVFKEKRLGRQMAENILINTIIPIIFTYGSLLKDEPLKEKALKWLEQLSAEKNIITDGFVQLGVSNKTAFDSQALIQLKNHYCNSKRCLECSVGNKILKGNQETNL